ncbi:MAG: hypothetical protein DRJ38_00200 [Thermoprotei archaeon]|nr:MAG: hypothetical protein DRJ38_00200 [Thermoprotei archaeon]
MVADYYTNADGKAVVVLFGRDKHGNRVRVEDDTFRPYFWAADPHGPETDIFGRPIRKIYANHPSEVRRLRERYEYHCEANIPFALRYLIDKGIRCGFEVDNEVRPAEPLGTPPKVLYFDIEVLSPKEILPRPEDARWPIVSMQFASSHSQTVEVFVYTPGESHYSEKPVYVYPCKHNEGTDQIVARVHFFDSEIDMLMSVIQFIVREDPDILAGYNIENFDFPYLYMRCKRLGVPLSEISPLGYVRVERSLHGKFRFDVSVKGREVFDLYRAYQKWTSGRQGVQTDRPFGVTYDFKVVVQTETGFEYTDYGDRIEDIAGTDVLIEYAAKDAYALKLLDRYCGLVNYFDQLRRIVGAPLKWAFSNKRLIEVELLRIRERPLPTRSQHEKADIQGALVISPPRPGIYENVAAYDLKSLYPTIICNFNVSPETKDPNGEIYAGIARFKRQPEGLIPRVVRRFTEQREHYRALRKQLPEGSEEYKRVRQLETLYKFLACSVYGATGHESFILYDPDCTASITWVGRQCITRLRKALEKIGYTLVYTDTDSVYVQIPSESKRMVHVIEHMLNEELYKFARTYGAKRPPEIKFERLFVRIFFKPGEKGAVKKRYAGITDTGQLYIIGFEPRRGDTAEITRRTMKRFFMKLLAENDLKGAVGVIREAYQQFEKLPVQDIAIPKGVDLHREYKARNPWLEGMRVAEKEFGWHFREDRKPKLVYTIRVGSRPCKSICITEDVERLPRSVVVDWKRMKEVTLRKKFEGLLAALGLDWNTVITGTRQTTLEVW